MIKAIAHVCFVCRDLDASIAFYRDKLGLKEAFDFVRENGQRFGVYLHVGGRNFVELFQGEHASGGAVPSYKHFCLEVDDIQATVAELRQKGLSTTDPSVGSDRSWQAWLTDPDGNKIELHAYTPQSKQGPWVKG